MHSEAKCAVAQLQIPPLPICQSHPFDAHAGWQTGKTGAGTVAFGQAELTLAVSTPKGALTSLREKTDLADYYLELSADPSLCRPADSYGLLLRASEDAAYRWILTCAGQMRLERWKGSDVAVLQDWTSRLGAPAPTRLAVWASGPELRFFINDIYQFTVRDPVLTSGSVGVFARASGDTPLTVSFSDLVVSQLEKAATGAATPVPSPAPTH